MAFFTIQLKSNEISNYANGDPGGIVGKNGFITRIGSIPVLVNAVSVIETGPSSNGNVEFTVQHL